MFARVAALAGLITLALSAAAYAQDSTQNGSKAIGAGSEVVKDLTESGVQTASAVGVVPASTAAGGSAVAGASVQGAGGTASTVAGASADFGTKPLAVTKSVVVAQPAPQVPYEAQPAKPKP